jgi:hypothetical protein
LHKRQCRELAQDEIRSIFDRMGEQEMSRICQYPKPSNLPLLLKLSAISWTTRPAFYDIHFVSLLGRATLLNKEGPSLSDTQERLLSLLKRAASEAPWSEPPEGMAHKPETYLRSLTDIARFGEPQAAVEILNRRVQDAERNKMAPKVLAKYYIYRLALLMSAAVKCEGDEGKRGAYVAEAKGLMERATRSLRGLQPDDWSASVSDSVLAGSLGLNRNASLRGYLCCVAVV